MKSWIVVHHRRHLDEFTGEDVFRLREGFEHATTVEYDNPDNITAEKLRELGVELPEELTGQVPWQELERHHVYLIGCGGSDMDEHGKDEYTCSAKLALRKTGLLARFNRKFGQPFFAALFDFVKYVLWADRNKGVGPHELPNMTKRRWRVFHGLLTGSLKLPEVLTRSMPTVALPRSMADVTRRVVQMTKLDLFVELADSVGLYTCMLKMVSGRQIVWDVFKVPGTDYFVRLAIITPETCTETDNSYAVLVARKLGADITFLITTKGHVGIFCSDNVKVVRKLKGDEDLTPVEIKEILGEEDRRLQVTFNLDVEGVLVNIHRREMAINGDERQLTDEELAAEDVEGLTTHYIPGSGTLLWGSDQSRRHTKRCPINPSGWIAAIKTKLRIRDVTVVWRFSQKMYGCPIECKVTAPSVKDPMVRVFQSHMRSLSQALDLQKEVKGLTASMGAVVASEPPVVAVVETDDVPEAVEAGALVAATAVSSTVTHMRCP